LQDNFLGCNTTNLTEDSISYTIERMNILMSATTNCRCNRSSSSCVSACKFVRSLYGYDSLRSTKVPIMRLKIVKTDDEEDSWRTAISILESRIYVDVLAWRFQTENSCRLMSTHDMRSASTTWALWQTHKEPTDVHVTYTYHITQSFTNIS